MRPQFTVVSAIYNVSEYIEAFLSSLERQTYGPDKLEVILVDDGSTDDSGDIAERWAHSSRVNVRVLHQENAGQGAARNSGIELATGEWVTFADPDDVLADSYFAEVAGFLAAHEQTPDLLATRQLTFTTDPADHADRHPLRRRFAKSQLVDLGRFPDHIQLSGCSAFFPLDRLKQSGLRFDTRIRPTFEDGHFIGLHLLESESPLVGFIRGAEYYYRKRADNSSSVQAGWSHPEKYTVVPRLGYLDLLRRGSERHGRAPLWAQNTVVYDLLWYFRTDARLTAPTGAPSPEVLAEFHATCEEIFELVDVETIMGFQIIATAHWLREALLAGYKDRQMRPQSVRLDSPDHHQRLVRARYTFAGPRPEEAFFWRGRRIEPVHQKVRAVELLGRALAYERVVWLPTDGTLRVELDGRPMPLSTRAPQSLPYQMSPAMLAKALGGPRKPAQRLGRRARVVRHLQAPVRRVAAVKTGLEQWSDTQERTARLAKRLAATRSARQRYAGAWVLMDRQDQAQDNAEHLYRYLKRKRPSVNAWFVLNRDSQDWARLEREGFKLVAYGSMAWRVLLLNARHVASSHANAFVENPLPARLYGRPGWRFTFLQHGVTKDDLSRWLNPKSIDLLITSTEPETQSFVADGTGYSYTTREVRQTGFPRHDALLARAGGLAASDVDRILVMPTWRRALTEGQNADLDLAERRAVVRESEYVRNWFAALSSDELREKAAAAGCRISFLPHPNMAPYLQPDDLPSHVEVLSWDDVDVQDVFARTKLLLTDYSSVAFEVALLGRPVVYYQFDEVEFFSGAQPYRRGYFDYRRDGFGPVVASHEDLLAALDEFAETDFQAGDEYGRRMKATFGEPTADACYRVYRAISQLDNPVKSRPLSGLVGADVDQVEPTDVSAFETPLQVALTDALTGEELTASDVLADAALSGDDGLDEAMDQALAQVLEETHLEDAVAERVAELRGSAVADGGPAEDLDR